ncbi:two-partner secretion domain-containing protein [Thermocoleostomius sinensis]|uniref:Filamentous hemagglutinin N-terminal domain-containing protein n=1 Tax=Thermocoleostomius sinensis A174 TaxID=2016057 RepID=A0A9E8ZJM2_9CYAN|nr:filamentous hemagglutinin N-terminal domain-containing protein [Thermocoleostomius sinensis]WAL59711.1 filamentous hemagglutinin N-terminal domain-containing protein [Thermocoleostomius sinensis A174]
MVSSLLIGGIGLEATAQPVPDDTLGNERSQVIDRGGANFDIDGGARRAANLFHSFQEFNITEGGSVYFLNPNGIDNILSRVTGSNPSNILGTLGVRGTANLFLINPNGILFGPNSRLDVGGSFAATTADAIEFGDRGFFSASNPETPSPLLTVNPSALFFNQLSTGDIASHSTTSDQSENSLLGLRVPDGESLLLVGGNVSLGGTGQGAGLHAPGGRVEIGAVAGVGRVGLNPDGSLTLPDGLARGNVTLQNQAIVNVRSTDGGAITMRAGNIRVTGESELLAGVLRNRGTPTSQAGDITLDATSTIQVQNLSRVANELGMNAVGNTEQGGNLYITTPVLEVLDGSQLRTSTDGQGNAGNIFITASDRVRLQGTVSRQESGGVSSRVNRNGNGNGGNISVTAPILEVLEGADLNASTQGQGNAGNVFITASERVTLQGTVVGRERQAILRGGVFSRVAIGGRGQGGNIRVETPILEVLNGARLSANTIGRGNAGNVYITASDRVRFEGTSANFRETRGGAFSTIETPEGKPDRAEEQPNNFVRQGGNVEITTSVLEVFNGAQLQTSTDGHGNAGDLIIIATDRVLFEGRSGPFLSGARSLVEGNGVGQGGTIYVETPVLEVLGGARLNASTQGQGDAGNITIQARERVRFQGFSPNRAFSGALSRVDRRGVGQGGTIRIRTSILEVLDGARLTANTDGQGNAGDIIIRASDRVRFQGVIPNGEFGGALSRVEADGIGQGGDLRIHTSVLEVLDGAQLQTNTRGQGDAGRINIWAREQVRFMGRVGRFPSGAFSRVDRVNDEQSGIGQGGRIRIHAPILEVLNGGRLNVNTNGSGDAGRVIIRATDRVIVDGFSQDRFSSAIFTITQGNARGRGGIVEITAPLVRVANAAIINGETNSLWPGGNITIEADQIEILNGGQIITTTASQGRAGNIRLDADRIRLAGRSTEVVQQYEGRLLEDNGRSGLFASTRRGSTGTGGRITVNGTNLTLQNGARISAQSQGTGMAGNIRLNVSDQLQLTNSDILTIADQSSGGDIQVNAAGDTGLIILRGDSDITTNSRGNGGNITLRGSGIIAFDDSDILARSQDARGGNITLDAFFSQNNALNSEEPFDGNDRVDINAAGDIESGTITTPDTSIIQNSLAELPDTAIDTDTLLANSCVVRSETGGNTFSIIGTGGLPVRPGDRPLLPHSTAPVRSIPDEPSDQSWQPGDAIVEPQGVYRLEDGRMVLSRECRLNAPR